MDPIDSFNSNMKGKNNKSSEVPIGIRQKIDTTIKAKRESLNGLLRDTTYSNNREI